MGMYLSVILMLQKCKYPGSLYWTFTVQQAATITSFVVDSLSLIFNFLTLLVVLKCLIHMCNIVDVCHKSCLPFSLADWQSILCGKKN